MSPFMFTPLIQRVTICSFFWLDATSKDSWQYVMWQVKAKQTNKKACEFNLKLYIFARNLIFGEKKIQSTLHICISMDSIEGWKIFGKKNSWNSKKHNFNLPPSSTICIVLTLYLGFPGGSDDISICLQCRRPGFYHWVRKIPWRRKWPPTPVLLPGKSHGRRSMVGYSPRGRKELDTTEQLHFLSFFLFFFIKLRRAWQRAVI